ncbi:MAG TPA: hypothetical protein VN540_06060 [Clostridia bacterium]|nr:hypothetical protein [Clostridia bacterium]
MALRKCPRCELNYIREGEKYCEVCKREMKGEGESEEAVQICVECGENSVVKGSELCAICLREARRQEKLAEAAEEIRTPDQINMPIAAVALDEIEVPLPADGEIPESELDEIDKELGDEDEDDADGDDGGDN